ncbi:Bromodomain-containing protein 8 [Hondaea fermentalgiana]|uniref:Bromodomain-containing protein 8 n=1 Tax=Hondaea fermentalgiana TaxID=2315210 RepID=A0A2R5GUT7_9STRA|nr:Bromodomain-containing protein 8 [Hondaea fermentalgiana]|eukprot:GBG31694.1 Bromodomain-containing protein 8 [Hondaea fermentalgiana]
MGKPDEALWRAEANRLVQKFVDDPESDYPTIVKEPMDLSTIKANLDKNKYSSFDDFVRHMRLIWSNCMAYNADGSDLYKVALKLKRKFDRDLSRAAKKLDPTGANSSSNNNNGATPNRSKYGKTPSQAEVADFCRLIYEIDEVQLGELIINIEETCESALRKRSSDDVDILVDRIDVSNFRRLETMLKQFTEQNKSLRPARTKIESASASSTVAGVKRPASDDIPMKDAAAEPTKKPKAEPAPETATAPTPAAAPEASILPSADPVVAAATDPPPAAAVEAVEPTAAPAAPAAPAAAPAAGDVAASESTASAAPASSAPEPAAANANGTDAS